MECSPGEVPCAHCSLWARLNADETALRLWACEMCPCQDVWWGDIAVDKCPATLGDAGARLMLILEVQFVLH